MLMMTNNRMLYYKRSGSVVITLAILSACSASPLKSDEDVWLFPVSANYTAQNTWNIPIHHWVFEKEEKSISRRVTQKLLSESIEKLGVSEKELKSATVRKRLMWFLVDNQRNKKIQIRFDGIQKTFKLNPTASNGHAQTNIRIEKLANDGDWLRYAVIDPIKPSRNFSGQVQLIPEEGLSVISDVDDTIKISNVLNKKALIKNTFVKPYQATQGFPEYYKELKQQGAYFHYVSASPWQLHPSLKAFMSKNYPQGTITLRNFRLKDSSIFKFLQSSEKYKVGKIIDIIKRYPKHRFILIGDSGEHDPEVYAKVYKQFPQNIQSIKIRAIDGSDLSPKRFTTTFKAVPKSLWQVLKRP